MIISCHAQESIAAEDLEMSELATGKHQKIVIRDKNVLDSLKVSYAVFVDFKYPLKDTTKVVKVDSVHIFWLTVVSLKNNKKILNYSSSNKKMSAYQKYIWNLCNNKFQYWYRNQPYETIAGRNLWDKRAVFGGGGLYITPK
jgi:hypothetical protein